MPSGNHQPGDANEAARQAMWGLGLGAMKVSLWWFVRGEGSEEVELLGGELRCWVMSEGWSRANCCARLPVVFLFRSRILLGLRL